MRSLTLLAAIVAACTTYRFTMDFDGKADVAGSTDGYLVVHAEGKGSVIVEKKEGDAWITAVFNGRPLKYDINGTFRKAWKRRGGLSVKFDEVAVDEALRALGLPADWPSGSAHAVPDDVRVRFVPRP